MTLKACLKSMRLRTLPLSLAGVLMGLWLALPDVSAATAVFLLLTTCSLQVLSNLSNELGDTLQGTDTAERQGMHYAVLDGEMTVQQLRGLVVLFAGCCLVFGALLIYFSFSTLLGWGPAVFMILGLAAVIAAMRYTLGRKPYGYRGLGDYYVFIFFGLVSTIGAYCICSHRLDLWRAILPACAIGLFSMGVLNVNNIRDMKTDVRTRITVALRLGLHKARIYQTCLICGGWIFMAVFIVFESCGWLCFTTLPLFALHLRGIWTRTERALDPMLPLLVMSTFLMSILFGVSIFC